MHQLGWRGIPHVIGMRESILDPAGTQFNRRLCDAIARQERVDVALQRARLSITQPLPGDKQESTYQTGLKERSWGQWCLPTLLRSGWCWMSLSGPSTGGDYIKRY
jgi:hypothetical protein